MSASESSTLHANTPVPTGQQSITTSKAPLLGEGFTVPTNQTSSKPGGSSDIDVDVDDSGSVSPAGSQIFERDVQESTLQPNSPAIPSHIQTEDHIPPVLDASSQAITNDALDPNTVEIVMHSSHQPAAMSMTAGGIGSNEPGAGMWMDELVAHPDKDDAASNYGALDKHAEHAGNRDSIYIAGLSALSSPGISSSVNRSPSPVRSPVSSFGFGNVTPDYLASPTSLHSPTNGGELTIETMTQAVRKTGSDDLSSGVRSLPLSPVSYDGPDTPFK
ncbi:hypothetical protein DID88_009071 [Monilinia fructigena]|uniref:Uncharacterized protein n=1 Tax=Monilinia fructigena TaxID=38457 RepID=A0A395II68_9HELO|nr:hypothetical protein DID88_009071 [Monilinia fructigena]